MFGNSSYSIYMKRTTILFFAAIIYSLIACNNVDSSIDTTSETNSSIETLTNNIRLKFILYDNITTSEVSIIKDKLEQNADRILDAFKIESIDTFKVHVWANYDNYLIAQEKLIGQRYNGSGGYVINSNELAMFFTTDVEETAEHEFVHAISLRVNSSNPRWLWESVATYRANEFVDPNELSYLKEGNFPTLTELNGDFNESDHKIYKVGYILSEFIIHEWGTDKYYELIQEAGDLQKVLNISEPEFETQWADFVKTKYFKNNN